MKGLLIVLSSMGLWSTSCYPGEIFVGAFTIPPPTSRRAAAVHYSHQVEYRTPRICPFFLTDIPTLSDTTTSIRGNTGKRISRLFASSVNRNNRNHNDQQQHAQQGSPTLRGFSFDDNSQNHGFSSSSFPTVLYAAAAAAVVKNEGFVAGSIREFKSKCQSMAAAAIIMTAGFFFSLPALSYDDAFYDLSGIVVPANTESISFSGLSGGTNDVSMGANHAQRMLPCFLRNTSRHPSLVFPGVPPAFAADDTFMGKLNEEIILNAQDKQQIELMRKRSTVLDEVWTLVRKYYVDNTYNSQDWDRVRDLFESRLVIQPDGSYDDEEAMKLATSMVKSLGDRYSRILDRESYAKIQKFDLIGVGATLMPDQDKRIMVGAPPIKGSEAEKAGIKYGDYILAVNGKETEGRTAFDIIDQIAEKPDADVVTMTVLTQGPNDIKGEGFKRDVTMRRQFVQVKNPIMYKISERRNDGTVVGYIRISEFNSLVKPKLEEAINNLKGEGANAFVMDLRGNPGGAFQSAVEIAGLFLDGKVATNVVDANQVEMPFLTTRGRALLEDTVPLVIWQDGRSASASEVLAGALHDQCRAVVMGSNSFGKGLIQAVYGLKNGTGLVLTVARYVTPAGTDIQGKGITPDIEANLPTPLIIGLSTDTSKVDFAQVAGQRNMCSSSLSLQNTN